MTMISRRCPLLTAVQQCLAVILIVQCLDGSLSSFKDKKNANVPFVAEAATASIRWGSVDDTTLFDFLLDGLERDRRFLQEFGDDFSNITTSNPTALPGTNSPTATPTESKKVVEPEEIAPLPFPQPKFPRCVYDGGEIVLSHPMSIGKDDRHYVLGTQMLNAAHISVDKINLYPRCGVTLWDEIDGMYKNYSITMQTYGDESDKDMTRLIGTAIVNNTDFMLAGYSSSLTAELTPIAQRNHRLCITGGSSRKSVHADRDYIFGLNPPSTSYLEYAFKGAYDNGATTAAYLKETTASACDGAAGMAEKYNMTLLVGVEIEEESDLGVYETVAKNISRLDPDLMITCVRTRMTHWNQAARNIDWTPKAQVYTYVVGTPEFEQEMPEADLPYVMGVSSWDSALPPIPDAVLGWTPSQFDGEFEKAAFRRPAYQHVQQSAVVSVLVQAMERVGSYTNQEAIRDVLATQYFPTVYGNVSFDENGQNAVPFLLLQYDDETNLHVLYPVSQKANNFTMVYPLPGYSFRDCEALSDCVSTNGTCMSDGYCSCDGKLKSNDLKGEFAECFIPPTKIFDKRANLIMVIAIPLATIGLFVCILVVYFYHIQKKQDKVWQIQMSELAFDDPPEIIGRGTFGEVMLAEYRGTKVAVKHIFPANKRKKKNTQSKDKDLRNNSRANSASSSDVMRSSYSSSASDDSSEEMPPLPSEPERVQSVGMVSKRRSSIDQISNTNRRKDFIRDMRHLSKMRHPCITTVMGAVVSAYEDPLLIMEFMDYGSLSDMLQNGTLLLEAEIILPMLQDITSGCRYLHATDVVHGDLKAANILVDSKFRAKVSDFGLRNKKGGAPYFMAPELLRQESPRTPFSDVYAFGILLYEVYSRRDPYEGEDAAQVLLQVADPTINKRPPVPHSCPPQMASLMADCTVADPEGRPTFEELDKRLKRVDVNAHADLASGFMGAGHRDRTKVSLIDIFPRHIAEALRDGKEVEPEHRDCVTIFFSDIVGFTDLSSTLDPRKVARLLDALYHKFDALSEKHDIFKVETIGDAYMAVTNLVKDQPNDHVKRIAEFAVDAINAANETPVDADDPSKGYVNLRVGFHSGPVVADVVGSRNPRYCLFGDTVNTASRMESNSLKNRIQCSKESADLLVNQNCIYPIKSRGVIEVKGKGEMHTFWINEGVGATRLSKTSKSTRKSMSKQQPETAPSPTKAPSPKVEVSIPSPSKAAENGNWSRMTPLGVIISNGNGNPLH